MGIYGFTDLQIEAGAAANVKRWRYEDVKMWLTRQKSYELRVKN
jgi:hypothetical protein